MIKTGIWGWEPPMYEKYKNGTYRVLFDPQQEQVERVHVDHETNEETIDTITQYRVKFIDRDLPQLTVAFRDNDQVAISRILLQERIKAYDSSDAVNSFTFNGYPIWLDKATRVGLVNSIGTEKRSGLTTSTLWFGEMSFDVDCETALYILEQLELYAIKCYNKTAEHLRNASQLTTVEELDNYDYRAGYPEKLVF